MNEPLFVFIALAGAAVLGFLFSTSLARLRTSKLNAEKVLLKNTLVEREAEIGGLQSECEARQMTIENLQKISQDIENQLIEKDIEKKSLRLEISRLKEEIHFLTENPIEKIKEIDVIREVPILVFKELSLPESRLEKAKKLMKAFTKGYLDENALLQTLTKEETIDEES